MRGYRLWDFSYDTNKKVPYLIALGTLYVWEGNVVGEKLDYLAQINDKYEYFDKNLNEWVVFASELSESPVIPQLGFWAFDQLAAAIVESDSWDDPILVGKVDGWGTLHRHEHGYRSEFMQILGFYRKIECTYPVWIEGEYMGCMDDAHYVVLLQDNENKFLCRKHYDMMNLNSRLVLAQYTSDQFFKDLTVKYGAGAHSYAELKGL